MSRNRDDWRTPHAGFDAPPAPIEYADEFAQLMGPSPRERSIRLVEQALYRTAIGLVVLMFGIIPAIRWLERAL